MWYLILIIQIPQLINLGYVHNYILFFFRIISDVSTKIEIFPKSEASWSFISIFLFKNCLIK